MWLFRLVRCRHCATLLLLLLLLASLLLVLSPLARRRPDCPDCPVPNGPDCPVPDGSACPPGHWCVALATRMLGGWSLPACRLRPNCSVVQNRSAAHALLFHGPEQRWPAPESLRKPPGQRWVFFSWEAPLNWPSEVHDRLRTWRRRLDWGASYSRRSHVVLPYGRTLLLPHPAPKLEPRWSAPRPFLALAVVSNCHTSNRRLPFIHDLIQIAPRGLIHLFGACGGPVQRDVDLFGSEVQRYHFFLSFENAFCRDYVTEKFWYNGLVAGAVPVAMGGLSQDDYKRMAPPNSFLYVPKGTSPVALLRRMQRIAADRKAYTALHAWRTRFRVQRLFMTDVVCAVCDRLDRHSQTSKPSGSLKRRLVTDQCSVTHQKRRRPAVY